MQMEVWNGICLVDRWKRIFLGFFFGLWVVTSMQGQLLTQNGHYQQVFVETDNFGSEYLQELDHILTLPLKDPVRQLVLNDLADFWHTRNLDSALNLALEGLKLAS